MVEIDDYKEEKSCIYKNEEYLVRDNGAVLRKTPAEKRPRNLDNEWTFGKPNIKTGYLEIGSARIHRIVATAFHGDPPTSEYIVDHIDTNRHNNRPSNLRWLTRLENVVLNETTRKRIEYRTGVSIFDFLENPSAYRECFDDPDFSWMRRVTEEEARICRQNIQKLVNKAQKSNGTPPSKLGEWIYQRSDSSYKNDMSKIERVQRNFPKEKPSVIDSLSPFAKQKDWRTPSEFPCCPKEICEDPISCYLSNMKENAVFTRNQYGESSIIKFSVLNNEVIIVITSLPSDIKPFALSKVTFENGYYLHSSLGSFFTEEGVEKQFTLAQGLEWTGGDSIDDYC